VIRSYLIFLCVLNGVLGLAVALTGGSLRRLVVVAIWSAVVYPLYFQLVKKKDWARVCLMVLTFPFGTTMLMMREVKLYMLQKG